MKGLLYFFSFFFLISSLGCNDDTGPIVVHEQYLGDEIVQKFNFKTGSWWIYKSSNNAYDTIKLIKAWRDTVKVVNDQGDVIGYQERFLNEYKSTLLSHAYQIFNISVSPSAGYIIVECDWNEFGGSCMLYRQPLELNVKYGEKANPNKYTEFVDTFTLKIDGLDRHCEKFLYSVWPPYKYKAAEVVYADGIGVFSTRNIGTGEIWELVSYKIVK